jgi:hypothetical protein
MPWDCTVPDCHLGYSLGLGDMVGLVVRVDPKRTYYTLAMISIGYMSYFYSKGGELCTMGGGSE